MKLKIILISILIKYSMIHDVKRFYVKRKTIYVVEETRSNWIPRAKHIVLTAILLNVMFLHRWEDFSYN